MKRKYLDNYNQFVGESPLAKDAEQDQFQTDFVPQMAVPVVHAFPDQQTDEQPVESTIEEQQPQKSRHNFDAESDENYEIRLLQEAIDKENSNRSNSKPIEHKETTVDGYQDACNQIETERQQLLEEEMFMNEMKESKQRMSRPASARKLSRQNSASGSVGKDKTKKKKKNIGTQASSASSI